jgi:hypothetical protein
MRIRTAHFPQIKTLEDFNLDHLPPHCDEICWPPWELAPSF